MAAGAFAVKAVCVRKVSDFLRNNVIKNVFCDLLALKMAYIDDENVVSVVDKVVITDVGAEIDLRA